MTIFLGFIFNFISEKEKFLQERKVLKMNKNDSSIFSFRDNFLT